MKRRPTKLEGILLGALVEITPAKPPADARCHAGIVEQADCAFCSKIFAAHAVIDKALAAQRRKDPKRTTGGRRRRPAPRGLVVGTNDERAVTGERDDGRGGKRVGERRQAARTFHIIDADSSARDVELARADLVGFFGDVLDKHHGGGF